MAHRDFRVSTLTTADVHTNADAQGLNLRFDPVAVPGSCVQQNTHFVLALDWQDVQARFAPFNLIQHFVRQLQRQQPDRIVIDRLTGATADLARIALAMGIPVHIETNAVQLAPHDPHAPRWQAALTHLCNETPAKPLTKNHGFGYALYALGLRNHTLLTAMQQPHAEHFAQCQRVLDVGCGTGVFLEILRQHNITAEGVERNTESARFTRSLGLEIHTQDALEFLAQTPNQYDGIYCSHFVEHLPIEAVERLIALCAQALQPGGVAVFTFPDPESIRSQLLGFWRDPEHVRFYHPELIETLAEVHGLQPEFNSQNITGRTVGPFSMQPPAASPAPARPLTVWQRLFKTLGLSTTADLAVLQAQNRHQQQLIDQLWQVNQTWAWEDNAVLRLRKPLS